MTKTINIEDVESFIEMFDMSHAHITTQLSNEQIAEFLEQHKHVSTFMKLDLFADYNLSQNLCEVQE